MRSNLALIAGLACAGTALASPQHYKDLLIGERAAGLGGAFGAISDDPSGIYHNPAGIVFALENYLSISANAFATTSQQYADIYPGQSYTYRSQALIPALFGFTQSVGRSKFGFAVIVPDAAQIDQSDTVGDSAQTRQFTRKFLRQDTTYLVGPAYAREILPNLSFGVSLFAAARFIRTLDNTTVLYSPIGTGKYMIYQLAASQSEYGLMPKLGIQYMPIPKLAIGLTLTRMFNVGGSGELRVQQNNLDTSNAPVTPVGNFTTDYSVSNTNKVFHDFASPYQASLAAAYFFNKAFLITGQVDGYTGQADYAEYALRPMFNWTLASEYYLSQSWALRGALFSNNSNAARVQSGGKNQAPSVDQLGTSLGLSMYRPGSSITLGLTYTRGTGQGQAFADSTLVQSVLENNFTVYLGGSYQL